jgi:hypothetical protein
MAGEKRHEDTFFIFSPIVRPLPAEERGFYESEHAKFYVFDVAFGKKGRARKSQVRWGCSRRFLSQKMTWHFEFWRSA